jgi:hypothetical protein
MAHPTAPTTIEGLSEELGDGRPLDAEEVLSRKVGMRSRHGHRKLFGIAPLALSAALVVAGCGGSSGSSFESSSGSSTASSSETSGGSSKGPGAGGFEITPKARACLKEQGLELPGRSGGGGGGPPEGFEGGQPPSGGAPAEANAETMQEAFKKCGVEGPRGGPGGSGTPPNMKLLRPS